MVLLVEKKVDNREVFEVRAALHDRAKLLLGRGMSKHLDDRLNPVKVVVAAKDQVNFWDLLRQGAIVRDPHVGQRDDYVALVVLLEVAGQFL